MKNKGESLWEIILRNKGKETTKWMALKLNSFMSSSQAIREEQLRAIDGDPFERVFVFWDEKAIYRQETAFWPVSLITAYEWNSCVVE